MRDHAQVALADEHRTSWGTKTHRNEVRSSDSERTIVNKVGINPDRPVFFEFRGDNKGQHPGDLGKEGKEPTPVRVQLRQPQENHPADRITQKNLALTVQFNHRWSIITLNPLSLQEANQGQTPMPHQQKEELHTPHATSQTKMHQKIVHPSPQVHRRWVFLGSQGIRYQHREKDLPTLRLKWTQVQESLRHPPQISWAGQGPRLRVAPVRLRPVSGPLLKREARGLRRVEDDSDISAASLIISITPLC